MGMVKAQDHRDYAILKAWIEGHHQDALAAQYGVQQPAISKAIDRAMAHYPKPEMAEEIRRTLLLLDELLVVYVPKAKAGTAWANREVRGLLALKGRFLGVERREVQVTVDGQVQVQVEAPETIVRRILDKQQQPALEILDAELVTP